jgi:hypothetical protein
MRSRKIVAAIALAIAGLFIFSTVLLAFWSALYVK